MNTKLLSPLFLSLVLSMTAQAKESPLTYIEAGSFGGNVERPLSKAVIVNDIIYLSGSLGIGEEGLVKGGVQAETTQAMNNIKNILEENNSSLENVIKCTVFLADMGEWQDMNDAYVKFFPKNKPARSAFGVGGIGMNGRVEIECFAAVASR